MAPHAGVSGHEPTHGMSSNSEGGGSSSRRRNTVQTEPSHGMWPNPILLPYNPAQLPYLLQWQLAYPGQLTPSMLAHQLLQYSPNLPPPVMQSMPQSRSRSPQKGSRQSSRSPERKDKANGEPLKQLGPGNRSSVNIRNNQTWSARSQNKATSPPIALPLRPSFPHSASMVSHHSNSLPSTPQQYPRQMTQSRSPSPSRLLQASPRSSYSEASSPHPTSRPFRSCRFEIGMAASRRRMPYSIGIDKLDPPTKPVKEVLSPEEDKKLTERMNELYKTLLPTAESEERRSSFVTKLQTLLDSMWPGKEMKVHVFGSTGNNLSTKDSDVDVCITTPTRELDRICKLADTLDRNGMSRVVCVSNAKVPIVKIWDPELNIACDMNINNTLALENTRMIRTYVDIDERVRPLAMIIKYWTRQRVLNDAAMGGTLSSYTWICMIINFLQTRNPPILPSLHKRKHKKRPPINGVDVSFDDDLQKLRGFGKGNKESLGSLLFHFFRRYGFEIDFENSVMSVREAKIISKVDKGWHLRQNNQLGIEEPFNTDRNLGNTADDTSVRGLHLEFRRAFEALADDADLTKCCEEYIFPVSESSSDRPIFERPVPQPLPVLSRSSSRSRNLRGGYAGSVRLPKTQTANGWGANLQNRRASSGMSYSNYATPYLGAEMPGGFLPQNGLPEAQPLPLDLSPEAIETRIRHAEAQARYLQQRLQLEQTQLLQLRQQQLQNQQQQQSQQRPTNSDLDDDDKQSKDSSTANSTSAQNLQSMYGSPMIMPFQNNMFMSHHGLVPVYPLDGNGMLMMPQQAGYYQGMQFAVPMTPQGDSNQTSSPTINDTPDVRPDLPRSTSGSSSTTLQSESQAETRLDASGLQLGNALGLTGFESATYQNTFASGQQQNGQEIYSSGGDGRTPNLNGGSREYWGYLTGDGKLNQYLPDSGFAGSSIPSSSQISNGSVPDRLLSPFSLGSGIYQDAALATGAKPAQGVNRKVSSTHYDDSPVLLDSSAFTDLASSNTGPGSLSYSTVSGIPNSNIASPRAEGSEKTDVHRRSLPHQLLGRPPIERVKSDKSVAQLSHSFVEATKSSLLQNNGIKPEANHLALNTKKPSSIGSDTSPKSGSPAEPKTKSNRQSRSDISYAQQASIKPALASSGPSTRSPKSFPANGETYANKLDSGRELSNTGVNKGAHSLPTSASSPRASTNANTNVNGHVKGASSGDSGGWQTTVKKRGKKRSSLPNATHHETGGFDGERKGG